MSAGGARAAEPLRVGVLFSGTGRSLENLALCCRQGSCPAEIVVAIASDPVAPGIARAESLGVPVQVVDWRREGERFQDRMETLLAEAGVELVLLAGFLRPFRVGEEFRGRVMNLHPSLLPAHGGRGFYGSRVHRAVLGAGDRATGCTVHFATDSYDQGPVILQRVIPVLQDDTVETLAARVFAEECKALPEAVRLYACGQLTIEENRVRVLGG